VDTTKCKTCGKVAKFKQKLGNVHSFIEEYVCKEGHLTYRRMIDDEEQKEKV